jgi:catechol 2,3-dioxygenase-like lactoylglutathione lyase family enzyme
MFSHVTLGAKDLAESKAFYDAIFGVLGYTQSFQDRPTRWWWASPSGNFGITTPIDGQPAGCGNGSTIGFGCDSDEKVAAWHAAGVAAGGTSVEDPPGLRNAGQPNAMYLAYLRDPAGNKLCAMHYIGAAD